MNVTGAIFALAIASLDVARVSSVLSLSVKFSMLLSLFQGKCTQTEKRGRVQRYYTNVLPAANMFHASVA